jgi:hypothetical protein
VKIKSIKKIQYSGPVYNIGVETDHTYFVEGVLVHNCRSILVPVTKFEDYKPTAPIDTGKLQEWGGNLILPDSKNFSAMPNLIVTGKANNAGDNIVIEAAGLERRIKIISITVANSDANNNVSMGFKTDSAGDVLYPQTLEKGIGSFNKEFADGWILEAGKPLILNLGLLAAVSYTIEYVIIDNIGNRVS